MTKTSKSNFGRYFCYKLANNKQPAIIFAILNFLSTILPQIVMFNHCSEIVEQLVDYPHANIIVITDISRWAFYSMAFSAIISVIIITLTTVKSMKIYHDRAAMDTLGCLPLSYGERFWGDLLSSICTNFITLLPMAIVSLIMAGFMRPMVQKIADSSFSELAIISNPHMISVLIIAMMISFLGIYAVTAFISSCCGKFGTSVVYSLVAMVALPGIYTVYANYFFSQIIGVDPYREISSNVSIMQPFGALFSVALRIVDQRISFNERFNFDLLIFRPGVLIGSALIIAAFMIGAYFVGKNRKAEKTGEGFVFKSVFYALIMTLLVMVFGVTSSYFLGEKSIFGLIFILFISFVLYSTLEFSQNRSFKGLWKTVIRYAAVIGACFAFMALVKASNGLDIYKKLPNENSIKEVRVSGVYFYSNSPGASNAEHIYKNAESISTIFNEHKKLLETDGLETGNRVDISYITKGGREIHRSYTIPNDDSPIKNFSGTVRALKEFDPSILGVIAKTDFSGITATYNPYSDDPKIEIRSNKTAELAEILRGDIEKYYFSSGEIDSETVGFLYFCDVRDERYNFVGNYDIHDVYKATLEFLNDPDNFEQEEEDVREKIFSLVYTSDNDDDMLSNISLDVSENDTSPYAIELLSYIEQSNFDDPDFEYSNIFVRDKSSSKYYSIREENKTAALKAMLNLYRERYAQ